MIQVKDLSAGYGETAILEGVTFDVHEGEVLVILGGSGSGKTTVLKHMIGLNPPLAGSILIHGQDLVTADEASRKILMRRFGVMYQMGALFGSMTLLENVRLPLEEFTDLPGDTMDLIALMKLDLVGLKDSAWLMPSEISGGMQKRAGLARAMALDPDILFFDEPSAGLDPISSVFRHRDRRCCGALVPAESARPGEVRTVRSGPHRSGRPRRQDRHHSGKDLRLRRPRAQQASLRRPGRPKRGRRGRPP